MHVMIDLETFGTSNQAYIASIGAVCYTEDRSVWKAFYKTIDPNSPGNGELTARTVDWWLSQDESSRAALRVGQVPLRAALLEFSAFVPEEALVWGNGATFDNVILRNAYERNGYETPWKFWQDRCYRTLLSLFPKQDVVRVGTYHNALDDAITQANHHLKLLGK